MAHQITPNQLYLLYYFRNRATPPLINVKAEMYLLRDSGYLDEYNRLTSKAQSLVLDAEAYFKKVKAKTTTASLGDDYRKQVQAYRSLFPTGQHPKLNYTFRSSPEDLTERFKWFFNRYPDYTWELVLYVTERFIAKARENNYQGLGRCNYLIKKTDGGTTVSGLADLCQNHLDELEENTSESQHFYVTRKS